MPDLRCHDGDLNGYGCISSQFVDSLFDTMTDPSTGQVVGNPQWFGRITRFRYELQLPNGTYVKDDAIAAAIANKLITKVTLIKVTYRLDPVDPNTVYAEGELEVIAAAGSPIPSSTAGQPYKFKHTMLRVWRVTETKLTV
jgi:hypothetical protein